MPQQPEEYIKLDFQKGSWDIFRNVWCLHITLEIRTQDWGACISVPGAVVANHKLGGLTSRNVTPNSGGWKSRMKMLSELLLWSLKRNSLPYLFQLWCLPWVLAVPWPVDGSFQSLPLLLNGCLLSLLPLSSLKNPDHIEIKAYPHLVWPHLN